MTKGPTILWLKIIKLAASFGPKRMLTLNLNQNVFACYPFAYHAIQLPSTTAKPGNQIILINHSCFYSMGTQGNQRIDSL
mgnify:CR=1 FL=1